MEEIIKKEDQEGSHQNKQENSNNITTNVTTGKRDIKGRFLEQLMPENGWAILAQFAVYKRPYSVNELHKTLKQIMHINTIRTMIERLKEKAWIRLYYRNTGRTHRENLYKITLDGLAAWEIYNAR